MYFSKYYGSTTIDFFTGYQKLDLVPDNNNPLPVKGQIVISLLSRDGHGSGKLEKSIIQIENH